MKLVMRLLGVTAVTLAAAAALAPAASAAPTVTPAECAMFGGRVAPAYVAPSGLGVFAARQCVGGAHHGKWVNAAPMTAVPHHAVPLYSTNYPSHPVPTFWG
ncbi:hypothetical protein Misp01_15850 [Microtetraspora sp. NBRC 13810]|uniref:hypothetical protein n=1 Tax=Microtetraspora sp. NBRC 13810 TaxID=3030990 RepID=UPI0024A244EB|nr:hypothetical protein [Microtetraspora sp. NBRC 13810]GLW06455.1 hypothetical protein Misp01_15850 [Microtetraspora sp. NBRC 13810]